MTASPITLRVFMRNHLLRLADLSAVTAVADFSANDLSEAWLPGVRLMSIPIARQIDLFADWKAMLALLRFFRKERFDLVHSVTPKAGLLAMTAARLAGVPHRIHCFTGQVWVTRRGLGRALLKTADRVIAMNATHLLSDSASQRAFLESESVVCRGRTEVLGAGSISGVDLDRFHPSEEIRRRFRAELGVPLDACLLLFVGRLNRDKGVLDLARAFLQLSRELGDIWLAVVGPDEAGIGTEFERTCGEAISHVRRVAYTAAPERAMACADVFVLPSYREGFGSVVLEAGACGIPSVVSRIYGLTDAVEENVTGLMHSPGDIVALRECLRRICTDSALRLRMGYAARARARDKFSMQAATMALVTYYERILGVERLAP